jgi:hypothetical protein
VVGCILLFCAVVINSFSEISKRLLLFGDNFLFIGNRGAMNGTTAKYYCKKTGVRSVPEIHFFSEGKSAFDPILQITVELFHALVKPVLRA